MSSDPIFEEAIDRRRLLLGAGAGALTLALGGCGSSPTSATSASATPSRRRPKVHKPKHTSIGDLRHEVRGRVITRGSHGYRNAAQVYNERFDGARPLAIVEARDEDDVSAAVRWAGRRDVRVVPRGGGHSYAGYSTGDDVLVIDLTEMRSASVDRRAGVANIGTGAQLIDVYAALAAAGLTTPAGSCPSVGAGGHVPAGGMGLAGRKLGLACDNLESLIIVTADGKIRKADHRSDADLYWAVRGGGGGNFGVATKYRMRVHPVSSVSYFQVNWPWDGASDALDAWQGFIPDAPDELTSIFHLSTGASTPSVSANGQYFGDESRLRDLLAPLLVSGADLSTGTLAYLDMMRFWAGCATGGLVACHTVGTRPGGRLPRAYFDAKSDYVSRRLPEAALRSLTAAVESRQADSSRGSGAILFDSYGGAINRVPARATAFVHRSELFAMQYLAYYPSPPEFKGADRWLTGAWRSMRPYVSGQAYQGYIDPALKGWEKAYYGRNYRRLSAIKAKYDPDFRFRFPQAIRPA